MCMLCVEINKGKMRAFEARKALGEFKPPVGHEKEVETLVRKLEEAEDIYGILIYTGNDLAGLED